MPEGDETDIVLRGVVRVENIESPQQYIPRLLDRVKPQYLERTYDISGWNDTIEFLALLARKGGRLLKGGEIDEAAVAKMVINDFLRGKIPWYVADPSWPEQNGKGEDVEFEGREGRLGEMRKKDGVAEVEGEMDDAASNAESWDGLDVETDVEADNDDDAITDDAISGDEDVDGAGNDERMEDPRPPKRARR